MNMSSQDTVTATSAVGAKRSRQTGHADRSARTHLARFARIIFSNYCRLDFKLATLMFKSLHGCSPLYLSDACQSTQETSHRLRSSSTTTYVIPRTRTRLGDRAFDVAGPRLWNNLPASLCSTDSFAQFRKQLKTYLFGD